MKPLLPAPLTQMDIYIWRRIERCEGRRYGEVNGDHFSASAILADRRDAELMLALSQIVPFVNFGKPVCAARRRMAHMFGPHAGELIEDCWDTLHAVDITNCA